MRKLFASVVAVSLVAGAPAVAQTRADQQNAREEMRAGRIMPIREIERRVVPDMREQGYSYLGPEWDPSAIAYRLKFIRETQVMWVDVDARTARILRVSR